MTLPHHISISIQFNTLHPCSIQRIQVPLPSVCQANNPFFSPVPGVSVHTVASFVYWLALDIEMVRSLQSTVLADKQQLHTTHSIYCHWGSSAASTPSLYRPGQGAYLQGISNILCIRMLIHMVIYQVTHIDGSVQERCNCSALAMQLRRSCINPSIWLYIAFSLFLIGCHSKSPTMTGQLDLTVQQDYE